MAYATISDVSARDVGRAPFTAATKPTASQVALYIEEQGARIDTILRTRGYITPVATGTSLPLLRYVCAVCADAQVQDAAQNSSRRDQTLAACQSAMAMLALAELDAASDLSSTGDLRYSTATAMFTIGTTFYAYGPDLPAPLF